MTLRNNPVRWVLSAAALICLIASPGEAQRRFSAESWNRDCNREGDRDSERFCRISESTMQSPDRALVIDGRTNGGVSVYGSSRRDVLIRARIQAHARTEERAEEIARAIRIRTDGGRIYAEGPETGRRESCRSATRWKSPRAPTSICTP